MTLSYKTMYSLGLQLHTLSKYAITSYPLVMFQYLSTELIHLFTDSFQFYSLIILLSSDETIVHFSYEFIPGS